MDSKKYEMIVCIVNAGFTGEVMEVAHKKGVMGGTMLHARGTANKEAEKFFKITITPEKDMIFMVVERTITDEVLKAIYDTVGLNTDANGIAFVLPVTNAIGIKEKN